MARGFRDRLMIMEQQTGPGGQTYLQRTPRRRNEPVGLSIHRPGADGVLHFRCAPPARERRNTGPACSSRTTSPRPLPGVQQEGNQIRRIGKEILGSRLVSDIASLKISTTSGLRLQYLTKEVDLSAEYDDLFQAASEAKHNIDFIGPTPISAATRLSSVPLI